MDEKQFEKFVITPPQSSPRQGEEVNVTERRSVEAAAIDGIFFSITFGFASGIVLEFFVSLPPLFFAALGIGALFFGFCIKNKKAKQIALFGGLFLLAMLLGGSRLAASRPDELLFAEVVGQKISVTGIAEQPTIKSTGVQFVLDTESGVNISVSTSAGTDVRYGDKVTVAGLLEKPQNFTTDQGIEFDYISYLYKDDILYQMRHASAAIISRDNGNWIVAHLIPLKEKIIGSFQRVLPESDADLLAGLNLGEKSAIDKNLRNDLVATGTIHIIALSGYNVTIVANALRDLFVDILGFSVRFASVAGGICIIVFVVMTGMQSSAVRAGIMALIGLFARGGGQTYNALRALLFAGFLMLVWNPKYLVYDVSFQLSFLATLGIIFITPILEHAFRRVPKKILFVFPLRELMAVTLGAQIGVLPFILYRMGTLSLISLPAIFLFAGSRTHDGIRRSCWNCRIILARVCLPDSVAYLDASRLYRQRRLIFCQSALCFDNAERSARNALLVALRDCFHIGISLLAGCAG